MVFDGDEPNRRGTVSELGGKHDKNRSLQGNDISAGQEKSKGQSGKTDGGNGPCLERISQGRFPTRDRT